MGVLELMALPSAQLSTCSALARLMAADMRHLGVVVHENPGLFVKDLRGVVDKYAFFVHLFESTCVFPMQVGFASGVAGVEGVLMCSPSNTPLPANATVHYGWNTIIGAMLLDSMSAHGLLGETGICALAFRRVVVAQFEVLLLSRGHEVAMVTDTTLLGNFNISQIGKIYWDSDFLSASVFKVVLPFKDIVEHGWSILHPGYEGMNIRGMRV